MILATLGASILGSMLTGKEIIRASEGTIRGDEGTIRAGEETIRTVGIFNLIF